MIISDYRSILSSFSGRILKLNFNIKREAPATHAIPQDWQRWHLAWQCWHLAPSDSFNFIHCSSSNKLLVMKQGRPKHREQPSQDKKKKAKQSFEERFKDKKNLVGRSGLLQVLDLHQPFDLNANFEQQPPSGPQTGVKAKTEVAKQAGPTSQREAKSTKKGRVGDNVIKQAKGPDEDKKLSLTHHEGKSRKPQKSNFRNNKTQIVKRSSDLNNQQSEAKAKKSVKLPRISKSVGNLIQHIYSERKLDTKELWRPEKKSLMGKKKSFGEVNFGSFIKQDHDASLHFQLLNKLQKMSEKAKSQRSRIKL